jgi:hypothetical protein
MKTHLDINRNDNNKKNKNDNDDVDMVEAKSEGGREKLRGHDSMNIVIISSIKCKDIAELIMNNIFAFYTHTSILKSSS